MVYDYTRIKISYEDAQILRDAMDSKIAACKNHIASAVENPTDINEARNLVKDLRKYERAFALVNGAILRMNGILRMTQEEYDANPTQGIDKE